HFATQMLLKAESSTDVERVRADLDLAIESLTFRPWMESGVPRGFPEFTPVHHIEVKSLPEYRMARTSMKPRQGSGESSVFWKLFGHIKRNDIAMTAPVQMDYTASDKDSEVATMAFLYGSREIGKTGSDAADDVVEIIDLPKQQVVSIGIRGKMSKDSFNRGRLALLQWLQAHENKYRPTG
ncbi:MAG: heme-binding protein, partial [Planctomycetales bacterium]